MRTRSRRAPLLAACALALAASSSAAAGDAQPAAARVMPATATPVSGTLSTPMGRRMAAELAELDKALIKHLKGERPSTFAALDARRKELKARIDAAALAPGDRKVLDERLNRTASVISRSLRLAGGAAGLDAELSKAVANAGTAAAKDPLYQIDVLLGDLDRASANPAEAEEIFDHLTRRYGSPKGASGAVAVNFGAIRKTLADTWSYTPEGAPGTNAAKARDLGRDTPAPARVPAAARGQSGDFAAMMSLSAGRAANALAERFFEVSTQDGRREIRFLPNAQGAPPAITLRVEKVATDGTFELERLVLQSGTHIVAKSPRVNQLLEGGKKNLGWEVALKSLVDATDGRKRLAVGRALARETIAALGMNDAGGRLSRPLGAFLAAAAKDTGDLIDPKQGAPIRFFINANKNYLLIFTRRDGTKRILSGAFKRATEFEDNAGLGMAFGVSGAIEIDADGRASQNEPKIETEYLGDGSRLVWLQPSPVKETPKTNLGLLGQWAMPWTNKRERTEFSVRRDLPPDPSRAEWNEDGKVWLSKKDTLDREIGGTSVFGAGSRWVASVPGVKQVFGVCGDAASTLYTGVVSGYQRIAYEITGTEAYLLEATGGDIRNPGIRLLLGGLEPEDPKAWRAWKDKLNEAYLSRSRIGGMDNREVLDVQARDRREKALALQGITERRAPQAYHDAMKAPVSEDERYDALGDFGAGTSGRRLAEDGHLFLGAAMSFGEGLGEGLLNPMMYVIPGVGRLSGAAGKTGLAASNPTVRAAAQVSEFGLRGFQYALLGSVVGSFSLSALDNIGKVSDYWGTPEASVKAGEALADLAFGGLMIRGFAKERARDRLAELKNPGEKGGPIDAPASVMEAAVAKGPPPTLSARIKSLAAEFWTDLKDPTARARREAAKKENFKDEMRGRANLRAEVSTQAKGEIALKENPGRLRRATQWLGEKGRALGERAEKGSRWIEKRPVTRLARGTVVLPITPAMKLNMAEPDAERNRNVKKDPPPPDKKNLEEVETPADTSSDAASSDDASSEDTPSDNAPSDDIPQQEPAPQVQGAGSPAGGGSGGGGGGEGGEGDGEGGKGPKAPKFGGFGGDKGGGGGGGGPAGNGADAVGRGFDGSGDADSVSGPGAGLQPSGPAVSAAPPPNLLGGGPEIAVSRGAKAVPNETAVAGGHSPEPSLASRFDGSRPQPASANSWSATPMKGLGAGDSPGLPRFAARAAASAAPASPDEAPLAARDSGGPAGPVRAAADATGVKPEEEDFSYTYMAPARHKYELPTDRPAEEKGWRHLLSLGLRGAAALAIAYLIYHSDLPYLVGLTRRRRDGTYGV